MARNQPEAQEPASAANQRSKGKMLLWVGVGLLALLLSAGGLAYALMARPADDSMANNTSNAPAVKQPALYQPLEPAFTVNFGQDGRQRYMQVHVVLMGRDPDAMKTLAGHLPLIRNQLVMLFGGADFNALSTPEGKEALREQATASVQALMEQELGKPVIESVLFTNLVLQ